MDLYKEITERIMNQMENGVIPWHKPWISGKANSRTTGKPYSLLNQMMLGKPGEYLTFKQCKCFIYYSSIIGSFQQLRVRCCSYIMRY